MVLCLADVFFFFFNDTATTEIYTLSLHDALPISSKAGCLITPRNISLRDRTIIRVRSEEHTSELQSRENIVCRLLLEKKKITKQGNASHTLISTTPREDTQIHLI